MCRHRYPSYALGMQGGYLKKFATPSEDWHTYFPCARPFGHAGPHKAFTLPEGQGAQIVTLNAWFLPGNLPDPARWLSADGVRAVPYPHVVWTELQPEWPFWRELLGGLRVDFPALEMLSIGFRPVGNGAGYAEVTDEGFRSWQVDEPGPAPIIDLVDGSQPRYLALHVKEPTVNQNDWEVVCGGYTRVLYKAEKQVIFPMITSGSAVVQAYSVGDADGKILWKGEVKPKIVLAVGTSAIITAPGPVLF